jgi:hypothetical protein
LPLFSGIDRLSPMPGQYRFTARTAAASSSDL